MDIVSTYHGNPSIGRDNPAFIQEAMERVEKKLKTELDMVYPGKNNPGLIDHSLENKLELF